MTHSCPLSFKTIDATVARINSLWIALTLLAYYFSGNLYFLLFIAADIFLRLSDKKEFSLFFQLSILLKKGLRLKSHMSDSGAKRLAAQFGVLFLALLLFSAEFKLELLHTLIYFTFLICLLLDIIFDYCVGCHIYFILKKFGLQ